MPNKTIYVKDTDLPLFEKMRAESGSSISARFADFLRVEESICNHMPMIQVVEPQATLRDQFAMAALIGLLAGSRSISGRAVLAAYMYADEMLEARK